MTFLLHKLFSDQNSEPNRFHFDALADDNDAKKREIEVTEGPQTPPTGPSPPAQPSCWALIGTQHVPKFNKSAEQADIVKIFVLLWRVDAKQMDVVLTINVPISTAEAGGVGEEGVGRVRQIWEKARSSFEVKDFELFA